MKKTPLPPRRHALVRSTTPRKRSPVKPVNRQRKAKESLRANGTEAYKEWLHDQPCAICGWIGKPGEMHEMHVKGGGVGRKANAEFTIPACGTHVKRLDGERWLDYVEGCHAESHRGQKTFAKKHGVDLLALAAENWDRWRAHEARAE